jgi:hypothetical protein
MPVHLGKKTTTGATRPQAFEKVSALNRGLSNRLPAFRFAVISGAPTTPQVTVW